MSSVGVPVAGARERFEEAKDAAKAVYSIAHAHGARAITARLRTASARITGVAVVAVVGERSRGKSSLVNELVERDRLLPVDVVDVTNAYVELRGRPAPARERAVVHMVGGETHEVELDSLVDYVSESGNPENERGVARVEVRCAAPLLEQGVRLLDTPGVGGLISSHGNVTLQALRDADAIVLVLSATEPVTSAELDFITKATEDAKPLVVALAKADDAEAVGEISEFDRTQLNARSPRFGSAPILPVSAMLAAEGRSLRESDPDYAEELAADSGLDSLRDALSELALEPALRSQADGLIAESLASLDELARPWREVVAAFEGATDPARRIEELRESARKLRTKRPAGEFDQAAAMIQRDLDARLRARIADARDELADDVELEWDKDLGEQLPERLRAALTEIWAGACKEIDEELLAEADRIAVELGAALDGPELGAEDGTDRVAKALSHGVRDPDSGWTQERVMRVGLRGMSPMTIGLAGMNPASIAAGIGIMVISEVLQRQASQQRQAQKLVDRTFRRATSELTRALDERSRELRASLREELDAPAETRLASLEASLAMLGGGPEGLARSKQKLAEVEPLYKRLESLGMPTEPGAER